MSLKPRGDRTWIAEAACNGAGPGLFFPSTQREEVAAKRICETCPVRPQCLEYSLIDPSTAGVWAGYNEDERRRIRRKRRRVA